MSPHSRDMEATRHKKGDNSKNRVALLSPFVASLSLFSEIKQNTEL